MSHVFRSVLVVEVDEFNEMKKGPDHVLPVKLFVLLLIMCFL